ncbi:type II toxin-antitoxin system VapC family toxin [Beijerinckia sp. L45]|uniref:type II toxin-antitoxin system VapC family toxin n=1 Tax=Beijerinckia sp. L45 TaxID=1641855 RepID=UPI00131D6306|nr:type II toxin-antitoxin system VapC family toxin [Beijerinckia sp. L45]
MKLLLDTHALLWWLSDDTRLGRTARNDIADASNDILVSVVSLWEIVVKVRIGKLEADIAAVERAIRHDAFERLAIAPAHLAMLATLPMHHRDPFDHLLIAQAIGEAAVLLSDDLHMALYPVETMRCGGT